MTGAVDFFSGLANGFMQTRQALKEKEQDKKERTAKLKLMDIELERQQAQRKADEASKKDRTDLLSQMSQGVAAPAPPVAYPSDPYSPEQADQYNQTIQQQGQAAQKKMSLSDMLADPQMSMKLINSGFVDAKTVLQAQEDANRIPNMLKSLQQFNAGSGSPTIPGTLGAASASGSAPTGSGSARPGGLQFSGLKFDTKGNPMLDFAPQQIFKEVPSPDNQNMIQIDRQGKVMGTRPMGPGEKQVPTQTKGQSSADEAFGKDYVEFKANGGYAGVVKNLQTVDEAAGLLDQGGITGPVRGRVPDLLKSFTNPNGIKVKQAVQEGVQANLRTVLGAQFTQKEGEGIMARAYDETLSDAENAHRVHRLAASIREAALAKKEAADYFEKNGTLTGFKGKLWNLADIEHAMQGSSKGAGGKQRVKVDAQGNVIGN